MKSYNIGGYCVEMQPKFPLLERRSVKYEDTDPHGEKIVIDTDTDNLYRMQKDNPHLSVEECEVIVTGSVFARKALETGGLVLHGCALRLRGSGILLMADSGGGKSTQRRYLQELCRDSVRVVNDDKPLLKFDGGGVTLHGTPWSGTSELNLDISADLRAIYFIEKSDAVSIKRMPEGDAIARIYPQLAKYHSGEHTALVLDYMDRIIKRIAVFEFRCTESLLSAQTLTRDVALL